MRKIIIATIAAAAMGVAAEIKPLDPATATVADYKAAVRDVASKGSWKECCHALAAYRMWEMPLEYVPQLKEEDVLLSKVGSFGPGYALLFPITWETVGRQAWAKEHPILSRLGEKLGCVPHPRTILINITDLVDMMDLLQELPACQRISYEDWASKFQSLSVKVIRKYLRRNGLSFVSKNGKNPCEAYLKELADILNAPRLSGIDKWMVKMGFQTPDMSWLPSDKELADLKERILDADEDITEKKRRILRIGLGSEKYNAFVKEYNGE